MENANSNHKYKPQTKSNLFWKGLSTWIFWLHPKNKCLNRKLLNYGSWRFTHNIKGNTVTFTGNFLTEYVVWMLECYPKDSSISEGPLKIMNWYPYKHFTMENDRKDRQKKKKKISALWFVKTLWRLWVILGWVHFMVNTLPDGFKHSGRVSSTTALSMAKWKVM